jgi:hypothetical protein
MAKAAKSSAVAQINALIGKSAKKKGGGAGGKKGRKIGRYDTHPSSQRYRSEQRWVKNQLRRVRRHIKAQPNDEQARGWLAANGGADAAAFLAATPKAA